MHPDDHGRLDEFVGQTLKGKYRLDALIGRGGFGAVFRAAQLPLGRRVAVKLSLLAVDHGMRTRFFREAQILAALEHPNIVQLLDYDEDTRYQPVPLLYMVQEFIDGRSLAAVLEETPRLPLPRAIGLVTQVLDALEAAHARGVVHRDIKPANLMVTTLADGSEKVRVLDFGIGKLMAEEGRRGDPTTRGLVGTPQYMAPEQCRSEGVTPATDIYAIGVLLYQMATGRLPFEAEVWVDYLFAHMNAPVPPLPDELPASFAAAVHRALAKDPADRFPSARAFAEALAGALDAAAGGAPPGVDRPTAPPAAAGGPIEPASMRSATLPQGTGTSRFGGSGAPGAERSPSVRTAPTAAWTAATRAGDSLVAARPDVGGAAPMSGRRRWLIAALAAGALVGALAWGWSWPASPGGEADAGSRRCGERRISCAGGGDGACGGAEPGLPPDVARRRPDAARRPTPRRPKPRRHRRRASRRAPSPRGRRRPIAAPLAAGAAVTPGASGLPAAPASARIRRVRSARSPPVGALRPRALVGLRSSDPRARARSATKKSARSGSTATAAAARGPH
ncbi:MAG: serine/threonine protein kinase [Myxococcales bacterium]|nr:serine/threonine protein kinase [Myxococcales bacterium]